MRKPAASPPVVPAQDPRQPADFDPLAVGKAVLRGGRVASLGTLDAQSGAPFVSLVSYATDYDGTPLLLTSRLSAHTRNLAADPRASLLIAQGGKGDPLAHPRLTLVCAAQRAVEPHIRARFLARNPKAKLYIDFPDFGFYRLEMEQVHLNGGFARAFAGEGALFRTPVADLAAFAAFETEALAYLKAQASAQMAQAAGRPGAWRPVALDSEGVDLALGEHIARLPFAHPVYDLHSLAAALKARVSAQ